MSEYYFKNKEFVIENYDKKRTFASFLPGIAGKRGIPLWCHYVNRAQGVTSFGLRDKNGCILEFYPANTAYRIVDKMGYRTFIKVENKVTEMFSPEKQALRKMYIKESSFRIEEIDEENNIKMEVTYFGLPNENIAGLVRRVKITNLGKERNFEVLDGITQLLPTSSNEWMLKHQSNLLKSWMDVVMLEHNIAYYITNSIPADEAEVNVSESGNYYFSLVNGEPVKPIFDANVIFDYDTTLRRAVNFEKMSVSKLLEIENIPADKVGVGFTAKQITLKEQEVLSIDTIIGTSAKPSLIINKVKEFMTKDYFEKAETLAQSLIDDITKDVKTKSNYPLFDNYMHQNYLDNILRGGYPMFIDTASKHFVYHLFSRRHGDMEREYNFFSIAPEYYSQGNGNFRDVCQNRRSDCLFHKEVGIYNAKVFANLIQLDGYNPLGVLGSLFVINDKDKAKQLANTLFINDPNKKMESILANKFTPGIIANTMENEGIKSNYTEDELFQIIFEEATQEINADFGEGYWSDHWTYILDLVESTLAIYPDRFDEYLYHDYDYKFYDSPVFVLPRSEKYVINKKGEPRQYGALLDKDEEKINRLKMNIYTSNWVKNQNNEEITTSLFGKLFVLATLKFSMLDANLIGVEMEGNKPGWNDAMNGLPGVFASGVSETIELARVVKFLKENLKEELVELPVEFVQFIENIKDVYNKHLDHFNTWDQVTTYRENYRENTRFGVQTTTKVKASDYLDFINLMIHTLDDGLKRALEIGNGIYPSYLVHEVTNFEKLGKISHYGLETIKVKAFNEKPLPYFLEAPARSMKYITDKEVLKNQYQKIKTTTLYDNNLKMYKTSCDLDDWDYSIGRIRAFQKGWLERESNFLHMTYKYLLGLIKAGLYDEFYQEIKDNLVCFMDPKRYGRSPFENSSFIAPSNNPDKAVWGQGFVARLSGSTAEMLSIWHLMMFGKNPFTYDKTLHLELKPALSKDMFNEEGIVEATFLSSIKVIYHNTTNESTFNKKVKKYICDGITYETLDGEIAQQIRDGFIKQIDAYF